MFPDTGRGLRRDAELIADVVREAGLEPEIEAYSQHSAWLHSFIDRIDWLRHCLPRPLQRVLNSLQRIVYRTFPDVSIAAIIHLQRVQSRYIAGPHENWLIPNQEWYWPRRLPYLDMVDRVLCKTREAESTFSQYHEQAVYIGFSGLLPDGGQNFASRDFRRFLHVAGNNRKKGSAAVVRAWQNHPEWPVLDLVIEDRTRLPVIPDNVRAHEKVSDSTLAELRRECGMVIAPSEAEGFGHVLLDAMAWGQIIVTVDAPPMNELVSSSRGFLVDYASSIPCNMGCQYFVDKLALESAVTQILESNQQDLEALSTSAREWAISNDQAFRQRMRSVLNELVH